VVSLNAAPRGRIKTLSRKGADYAEKTQQDDKDCFHRIDWSLGLPCLARGDRLARETLNFIQPVAQQRTQLVRAERLAIDRRSGEQLNQFKSLFVDPGHRAGFLRVRHHCRGNYPGDPVEADNAALKIIPVDDMKNFFRRAPRRLRRKRLALHGRDYVASPSREQVRSRNSVPTPPIY